MSPATGSATRGTSAMTCSPRSKNPPTVTCWTGKNSSISRSTRSATSSKRSSQTSRPGESCTPTIVALWTPSPKPSQPSSHYTSTNWPVNKPHGKENAKLLMREGKLVPHDSLYVVYKVCYTVDRHAFGRSSNNDEI